MMVGLMAPVRAAPGPDFSQLSVEELMDIDVQLPLRMSRPLFATPSAVYALDADSIRRSGANSVAELLRLVPGVEVTRFGSAKWGIGIRGFNGGVFTNRLLILVDGRSVFSPAKIGMFWDMLDTPVEDIERIVVVRGPGAALWGSNAINGVIHVITRRASKTSSGLVTLASGSADQLEAGLRYGTALSDNWSARAHLKWIDRRAAQRPDGRSNDDAWQSLFLGLRADGELAGGDLVSLMLETRQGDGGEAILLPRLDPPRGELVTGPVEYSGSNLQLSWRRSWNANNDSLLQVVLDRVERRDVLFDLRIDTVDLEFEHDRRLGQSTRLIWGLSNRITWDRLPEQYLRFTPSERRYAVQGAFAQLEQQLGRLPADLIAGIKLERNDFSGTELQPSLRLVWLAGPQATAWAAVSRAERTPSRTEHDVTIDFDLVPLEDGSLMQLQIQGDRGFRSERLTAYELGWRQRWHSGLALELSGFVHDYQGLRTLEPGEPYPAENPPPDLFLPLFAANGADARSWGGELQLRQEISTRLRAELAYAFVDIAISPRDSRDPNVANAEGESPRHRAWLRTAWDLSPSLEWNTQLRYAGPVPRHRIDAYLEADSSLVWRPSRSLELSLVGRNLLSGDHQEFVDPVVGTPRALVEREGMLRLRWQFF